ncbi:hypothetical protein VPH35_102544 [Triticum aestivum]
MAAWAKRSGFGSRGAQGLLPQQTPRVPPSPTLTSSAAANEISLSPSTPAKASTRHPPKRENLLEKTMNYFPERLDFLHGTMAL